MFTVESIPTPAIGGFVVHLAGSCDFNCSERFGEHLAQLDIQNPTHLIFDCTRLDFISSIGLGQLLELRKNLLARGGRLAMAGMNPNIHRGVTYTRLDEVFEVFPNLQSALGALANPSITVPQRPRPTPAT
jgi:anti-sigma B factor antagonist